ncbi:unnamed protein product [Cylicocyclus nassatus]|uniref:Uncharacterized protein n=1 Tax=Cylicocyclus nassatus TaxID=53992 RepID=A0AA36HF95_CYLNA|nr:unnamed protein product [Cylicocyclus nassatus]
MWLLLSMLESFTEQLPQQNESTSRPEYKMLIFDEVRLPPLSLLSELFFPVFSENGTSAV